jgi:predicted nucleic-acid-binding protein
LIGLDTNVLVRYLVQDDAMQLARATELIERRLTPASPGFISIVTIVETVWVLHRAYGFTRQEISSAVERVLQADVLVMQNEQEVFTAMVALRDGRGAFADALIGEFGLTAGCSYTYTFDRKTTQLSSFKIL